ncbi:MAG: NAD(P)-dependent oxidoreductase [Syntrophales bacterium]|nr:NAD(P)-dependent oxidoreductase [Syntrophales bacterium]
MKKTALIINTSRGGVIDEPDLIRALREGVIAGAGLDVFEHEPIQPGNELLSMKNVILTPHTAALTEECVNRMAVAGAERVVDLFNGFIPETWPIRKSFRLRGGNTFGRNSVNVFFFMARHQRRVKSDATAAGPCESRGTIFAKASRKDVRPWDGK